MKFFTALRNQAAAIVTLLCMLLLGLGYFFMYVPANEKNIQEQRFKALQHVDKNIHEKIENSVALLKNLLRSYSNPQNQQSVKEYINKYSPANFTLTDPTDQQVNADSTANMPDNFYRVYINDTSKQIILEFEMLLKSEGNKKTLLSKIQMRFSIKQFIEPLLPSDEFEQYVILNGKYPVYESFSSGISEVIQDSLLSKKSGLTTSTIYNHSIAGSDYKLFLQPVSITNASDHWIVAGLISAKTYQKEKNKLPVPAILLMITVLLVIIVAFPWIRIFQMGSKDRLTATDGSSSVLVAMILLSLFFIGFCKYNARFRPDSKYFSKTVLADSISHAFMNETKEHYHILDSLDRIISKTGKDSNCNMVRIDDSAYIINQPNRLLADGEIARLVKPRKIKQVFWIDGDGNEKINWTREQRNAPLSRFTERKYFKNIISNHTNLVDNDTSKPYYLDQVVSWTSGNFTSVISKPTGAKGNTKLRVAAMSFTMQSVDSVVLPTGFIFAITDKSGKVLYHSNTTRNLNDSLPDGFSAVKELRSCYEGKATGDFTTRYSGNDYEVKVQPIAGTDFFILILSDLSYKSTRDAEIYSFTFGMLLCFFLFLVIKLLLLFFASAKRSYFKKHVFDTSWVGPRISFHREYVLATLFNLLVVIVLFILFSYFSFLQYLFSLLLAVSYSALVYSWLLWIKYKTTNHDNYKHKRSGIIFLSAVIILTHIVLFFMLEWVHVGGLVFMELITWLVARVLYHYRIHIIAILKIFIKRNPFLNWGFGKSFATMALSRLLITSGIPALFFYVSAYNFEQEISIRHKHLVVSEKLKEKFSINQLSNTDISRLPGVYLDKNWIDTIGIATVSNTNPIWKSNIHYNREDSLTVQLLQAFRLPVSEKAVSEAQLYKSLAADSSFLFNNLLKKTDDNSNGSITWFRLAPQVYLNLHSAKFNYLFPSLHALGFTLWSGILFWLLLLLFLFIYGFVLYQVIRKLFALNRPNLLSWKELDIAILTDNTIDNLHFVIGLPGAGKKEKVINLIKDGSINDKGNRYILPGGSEISNVFIADLINIPDSANNADDVSIWKSYENEMYDPRYKMVIVNHFEYNVQDTETNRIKLNLLERLMVKGNKRLILLSTIHPVAFLDSLQTPDTSDKTDNNTSFPGQDLERWHILLGHYRIVIMPLEMESNQSELSELEPWLKKLHKETEYTRFLHKMGNTIQRVAASSKDKDRMAEDLPFKLQVTAHYFYMYIWQSLTKEEKFLLYDLAEDNLVNAYDDYTLNMLIAKGVIIDHDGSLRMFNIGFRNFILTAIGNTEANKIQNTINDNGNWNKLKGPLMVVIIAILFFLFISQENTYSRILSYIAAFAAGIPTIIKLFGLFDKSPQKS
jgi:hypothetical protein